MSGAGIARRDDLRAGDGLGPCRHRRHPDLRPGGCSMPWRAWRSRRRRRATRPARVSSTRATGDTIDDGLVLFFPAPASVTGEDVAELHLHGSRAVLDAVTAVLRALPDFRLAEPGEFTRRGFEHGKLDLTEAEAIADLVAAETAAQRRQALRQLDGELGRLYGGWARRLLRVIAHLEAVDRLSGGGSAGRLAAPGARGRGVESADRRASRRQPPRRDPPRRRVGRHRRARRMSENLVFSMRWRDGTWPLPRPWRGRRATSSRCGSTSAGIR